MVQEGLKLNNCGTKDSADNISIGNNKKSRGAFSWLSVWDRVKITLRNTLKDDLAKDAFIVFLATGFINFFNLLYSLFLLRNLNTIDFGLFNSLLALLMIFSQFPGTAALVLTRFISQYHARKDFAKIRELIVSLSSKVLGIGIVVFLLAMLGHNPLANFLKIPNNEVFIILNLTVLFTYFAVIPAAALQGLQKFSYLSFSSIATGLIKLVLVVLLVKLGWGVIGALNAFLFSTIVNVLVCIYFLKVMLARENIVSSKTIDKTDFQEVYRYFLPVFLMTLVTVSLNNIDIVLVKHFFSPTQAGLYSIAQVVGKIVLFFPAAIITVMFPKVANLQAKNEDTRFILKRGLVYMFTLSGIVASCAIIFPEWMLRILTRKSYPECIALVRLFSVNMLLLNLLFVFLNYYLSLNIQKYIYSFLAAVILEVLLINLFHQSLLEVLVVIFICFSGLLFFNIFMVLKRPSLHEKEC